MGEEGKRADVESADTLVQSISGAKTITPTSEPRQVDPGEARVADVAPSARYEARRVLGRGGMGEVRLCRDERIGREVAMKVIGGEHGSRSDARARFVREARVQGQLEHPAIVPVYDLGVTDAGDAFFTMKRIGGQTLEEVLELLRKGDDATLARVSRRKLLTAFSQVCLAIDFAHTRGVVHRDLKPGNVILGDFGEVYVLDWGLAKITGAPDVAAADATTLPALDADAAGAQTRDGQILGTPGYMAPEQLRGAPIDPRADVYALGAVLFEILTLEPLHVRTTVHALMHSTLVGADARARARAPERDVPPELEALCVEATRVEPAARLASARALHDAIERYLDGDRDLAMRRQLAAAATETAEHAAERALEGGAASGEARATALRELGRALAFDPGNAGAMRTLIGLLLEPPKQLPPEAELEVAKVDEDSMRVAARSGGFAFLSWFAFFPLVLWMGFREPWTSVVAGALMTVACAGSFAIARLSRPRPAHTTAVFVVSCLALAMMSAMFGPFMLVPAVVAVNTLAFAAEPVAGNRAGIVAVGCLTVLVPGLLEWAGWVGPAYVFEEGVITILPNAIDFPELPTRVFLLAALTINIVAAGAVMLRVRERVVHTTRRLHLLTWQLRQLVPSEAQGALATSVAPPPVDPYCPIDLR